MNLHEVTPPSPVWPHWVHADRACGPWCLQPERIADPTQDWFDQYAGTDHHSCLRQFAASREVYFCECGNCPDTAYYHYLDASLIDQEDIVCFPCREGDHPQPPA